MISNQYTNGMRGHVLVARNNPCCELGLLCQVWRLSHLCRQRQNIELVFAMSSRITVKRNLIIFHNPGEWSDIYASILRDFGMGMAIRTRLRRELGFVYRHHQGLEPNLNPRKDGPTMYYEDQVHLDFYSEAAQSWFQLKYLNR